MLIAKIVSFMGILSMGAVLIYGFTYGNFAEDGAQLLSNPWGIISIVDLYVGFILFSMWIIYREKSMPLAMLWVVLMMVLGFLTGALYTFIALQKSDGNWERFFMGNRSSRNND